MGVDVCLCVCVCVCVRAFFMRKDEERRHERSTPQAPANVGGAGKKFKEGEREVEIEDPIFTFFCV